MDRPCHKKNSMFGTSTENNSVIAGSVKFDVSMDQSEQATHLESARAPQNNKNIFNLGPGGVFKKESSPFVASRTQSNSFEFMGEKPSSASATHKQLLTETTSVLPLTESVNATLHQTSSKTPRSLHCNRVDWGTEKLEKLNQTLITD